VSLDTADTELFATDGAVRVSFTAEAFVTLSALTVCVVALEEVIDEFDDDELTLGAAAEAESETLVAVVSDRSED
jgi:hypothetical protein